MSRIDFDAHSGLKESALRMMYESGRLRGHSEGYETGYDAGYADGFSWRAWGWVAALGLLAVGVVAFLSGALL